MKREAKLRAELELGATFNSFKFDNNSKQDTFRGGKWETVELEIFENIYRIYDARADSWEGCFWIDRPTFNSFTKSEELSEFAYPDINTYVDTDFARSRLAVKESWSDMSKIVIGSIQKKFLAAYGPVKYQSLMPIKGDEKYDKASQEEKKKYDKNNVILMGGFNQIYINYNDVKNNMVCFSSPLINMVRK